MKEKNAMESIIKNLALEAKIKDVVAYFPMRGASVAENFRSPDSYVFMLYEKCSGSHTVDFKKYEQTDLQIHISFPKQIHSWNTGPDAIGHKLIISKDFIEESQFSQQFSIVSVNNFPVISIDLQTYQKLSSEFLAIAQDLITYEHSFKWKLVRQRLQVIVMLINHIVEGKMYANQGQAVENNINQLLIRFGNLVNQNFQSFRNVRQYADLLHISANYLNVLCQRHLQLSAKEFIDARVILEAKRLLKSSNIRIKELAFSLGFSELGNFTSFFKKYTGVTPLHLRKNS